MAFSPLHTFQKNRRFWMACILGLCMVTFVFCGNLKGDLGDKIIMWLGGRGESIGRVAGRSVSKKELYELKAQREAADFLMKLCVSEAYNKATIIFYEAQKKQVNDKEMNKRQQALTHLEGIRMVLAQRKARPYYFETGHKLDDLLEFMLWQAQADAMDIRLEPEHVDALFQWEFLNPIGQNFMERSEGWLSAQERSVAEQRTQSALHIGSRSQIVHAIREEFRVKIAQYAVMAAQPGSFLLRSGKQGESMPKMFQSEAPDELRTPLTMAQLWDIFKHHRAEFDVTLLPVHVQDFTKEMRQPTTEELAEYFKQNNQPFDPTSPQRGIEAPPRIKIEYVMADPTSPAYLNMAHIKALFEVTSPVAWNPMQSPVTVAARYALAREMEVKVHLQRNLERLSRGREDKYVSASMGAGSGSSAMAAYFAHRYPQAAASVIGASFLTPQDGLGALTGYIAWGAFENPLKGDWTSGPAFRPEIAAGVRAELMRRAPIYATMFPPASAFNQPFEVLNLASILSRTPPGELPVEVIQSDLRDIVARKQAEEWARESMQIVKRALDNATGNEPAERMRRVLKKLVPELNLTHGPKDKDQYYHRYNVDEAKELEPLKEAFNKSIDTINLFEGRDINPATLLKPGDFYRMFFSNELFAASALDRAMPWPPAVKPDRARSWTKPNSRLIDLANVNEQARENFAQMQMETGPREAPPSLDLFASADKPILFWRTAETTPTPLEKYAQIEPKLKETQAEIAKLKAMPTLSASGKKRLGDLLVAESDLKDISARTLEGWKFEQARTAALPRAKAIAEALIKSENDPNVLLNEAKTLKRELIPLKRLSRMHPERLPNGDLDYFEYALPKGVIEYARDDMAKQLVRLYDLKSSKIMVLDEDRDNRFPVEIRDPDPDKAKKDPFTIELDKINKELFDRVKEQKNPDGRFVQIYTNSPRSAFYIGSVTAQPRPDRLGFATALGQSPLKAQQFMPRDFFVQRAHEAYEVEARAALVRNLRNSLGFSVENLAKLREDFDRVRSD